MGLDNIQYFKAEKQRKIENNKKFISNDNSKNGKKKQNDDRKANVENVKYEYRQGGEDLRKIIPFCNNHFIIQERD
jgi:hypothetical protein